MVTQQTVSAQLGLPRTLAGLPRTPVMVGSRVAGSRRPVWVSLAVHVLVAGVVLMVGLWQGPDRRADPYARQNEPSLEVEVIVEPQPQPQPKPKPKLAPVLAPVPRSSAPAAFVPPAPPPPIVQKSPPQKPSPQKQNAARQKAAPLPLATSSFQVAETGMEGARSEVSVQGQDTAPLSATERDFILMQILPYLRPNAGAAARKDAAIMGYVIVLENGMLEAPFNANEDWNPQAAMPQYVQAQRSGDAFTQQALESFYLALRLAQPLTLPPGTAGTWPRRISVSVTLKDAFGR